MGYITQNIRLEGNPISESKIFGRPIIFTYMSLPKKSFVELRVGKGRQQVVLWQEY
jgi:hypothetical protein